MVLGVKVGASRRRGTGTGPGFGLTTATARLLLGPGEHWGARADHVSQRLGQAIRFGLLIDGERLPAEGRLATLMGVSTVTLREGLSALREQGLIVTRRGRHGGTFVRAPDDERGPLRTFSVHDLRELGDQRAAISGAAARLAAERGLPDDVRRLIEQVQRLAVAETVSERRRADTQLAIGVAAAAQSSRLTREEANLHAELGDLLGMLMAGRAHHQIVARRRELIEAIASRRPEDARLLAERHVAAQTERLIALHLEMSGASPAGGDPVPALPAAVVEELEGVFVALAELAGRFGALIDATPAPRTEDLSRLHEAIFATLAARADLISGAGVVVAPSLLADAPRWLEWWSAPVPGAKPDRLRVNLEPTAPDFYDYTALDWFASPAATGAAHLAGPFVDDACTNLYAITLAVPASSRAGFCGVAAADVLVSSLEAKLLPELAALDRPTALTTREGRVIASTDPGLASGSRLDLAGCPAVPVSTRPPVSSLRLVTPHAP
ncbi:MAG: GntR family transcriptional regulator [Solirubrobacteraceae bacterium]